MTYPEMIERLEQEKGLLENLKIQLEMELALISQGNVQALEESMMYKQKLIKDIANLREEIKEPQSKPIPEQAKKMRALQHELKVLWKKVTGLNDLSKNFVMERLSEIETKIEIFFSGLKKNSYTRDGKKSAIVSHTIKTGA
jgi:hypothetical protein